MRTAIVVGNPKPRSRTFHAAYALVTQLSGGPPDLALDLADLGAALLDWQDPQVVRTVSDVCAAELAVVASPTYKGSYTGLLKLFLDRFPADSLRGVMVIPLMLGGDARHSLAPEVFLRPVLAELGAWTPSRALFLLESQYADSAPRQAWIDATGQQFRMEGRL